MAIELNPDQIEEFQDRGYIVVRKLIPRDMLEELIVDYDRATRGELDVPEWSHRFGENKTLQLGHPSRKIAGWADHEYRKIIVHHAADRGRASDQVFDSRHGRVVDLDEA